MFICTLMTTFHSLAAEFLGEKLAAFFGITTPKYQYVIDEYYRLKELVSYVMFIGCFLFL